MWLLQVSEYYSRGVLQYKAGADRDFVDAFTVLNLSKKCFTVPNTGYWLFFSQYCAKVNNPGGGGVGGSEQRNGSTCKESEGVVF